MTSLEETIQQLIRYVYNPSATNDGRRQAVEQLQYYGGFPDGMQTQILNASWAIWGNSNEDLAVRCYALSMITNGIERERLPPTSVNAPVVLNAISGTEPIPKLFSKSCVDLVVAVAKRTWPNQWANFLDLLCPSDITSRPALLSCLMEFVHLCIEKEPKMRRTLGPAADRILNAVIAALAECCPAAQQGSESALRTAEAGLEILQEMTHMLPTEDRFWALNLDGVYSTLFGIPALMPAVVEGCSVLIQSGKMTATNARSTAFLTNFLMCAQPVATNELWSSLFEILTVAHHLPPPMVEAVRPHLVNLAAVALTLSSILFAQISCDIIVKSATPETPGVNPEGILTRLLPLTSKNEVHPIKASNPQASAFSQLHFATMESFDLGFADFRNSAGSLMEWLASRFPRECVGFISGLVQYLTAPTTTDARGPCGHVTQNSVTFSTWSTCLFFAERLSNAYLTALDSVEEIFTRFSQADRRPTDATLAPVYLNFLSTFWKSPSLPHWSTTMEIIFQYMTLQNPRMIQHASNPALQQQFYYDDVDLGAARKRACTLLIRVCNEYGPQLFPWLQQLMNKFQDLLISNKIFPVERGFLFEAVASLSNCMNSEQQRSFIGPLIETHFQVLNAVSSQISPEAVVRLVVPSHGQGRDDRYALLDSVGVLGPMLRRCNPSPYLQEAAARLLPVFSSLVCSLHALTSNMFPPEVSDVLELSSAEKDQFRVTGNRRSEPSTEQKRIRGRLTALRLGCYTALGALPKFLPVTTVGSHLSAVLANSAKLPIHAMRSLFEHCLRNVIELCPPALEVVIPGLQQFLSAQLSSAACLMGDEATEKQLYHFGRDLIDILQKLFEMQLHENAQVKGLVFQFFCVILESGIAARKLVSVGLALGPALPVEIYGICCKTAVTSPRLDDREKEFILSLLADPYITQFPRLTPGLVQAGMTEAALSELHIALGCIRLEMKRQRFKEVLLRSLRPR